MLENLLEDRGRFVDLASPVCQTRGAWGKGRKKFCSMASALSAIQVVAFFLYLPSRPLNDVDSSRAGTTHGAGRQRAFSSGAVRVHCSRC